MSQEKQEENQETCTLVDRVETNKVVTLSVGSSPSDCLWAAKSAMHKIFGFTLLHFGFQTRLLICERSDAGRTIWRGITWMPGQINNSRINAKLPEKQPG